MAVEAHERRRSEQPEHPERRVAPAQVPLGDPHALPCCRACWARGTIAGVIFNPRELPAGG